LDLAEGFTLSANKAQLNLLTLKTQAAEPMYHSLDVVQTPFLLFAPLKLQHC
jgi:hypothetical protein